MGLLAAATPAVANIPGRSVRSTARSNNWSLRRQVHPPLFRTQWRLSATARLAWYGGESHRRYRRRRKNFKPARRCQSDGWSLRFRAVPRKGGRALTHTATSSALPATRTGSGRPHDRPQRLLPAQPALTDTPVLAPQRDTAAARQQRRECDPHSLDLLSSEAERSPEGRSGHSVISGSPPRGFKPGQGLA